MHPSVLRMWQAWCARHPRDAHAATPPPAWHFCDREEDADTCARLVLAGVKRATSPSLWSFTRDDEALPEIGALNIVTDWAGCAVCMIRTTAVQVLAFDAVSAWHAALEGEGDGSLAWWRAAHRAYYERELAGSGRTFGHDMAVVFQIFERVFPEPDAPDTRRNPDRAASRPRPAATHGG